MRRFLLDYVLQPAPVAVVGSIVAAGVCYVLGWLLLRISDYSLSLFALTVAGSLLGLFALAVAMEKPRP